MLTSLTTRMFCGIVGRSADAPVLALANLKPASVLLLVLSVRFVTLMVTTMLMNGVVLMLPDDGDDDLFSLKDVSFPSTMKMKHDHLFRLSGKASPAPVGRNVQTQRVVENLMRLRWDSGQIQIQIQI